MVVVGEHSGELGPGGLNRRATTLGWSDESGFGEGGCDSGGMANVSVSPKAGALCSNNADFRRSRSDLVVA